MQHLRYNLIISVCIVAALLVTSIGAAITSGTSIDGGIEPVSATGKLPGTADGRVDVSADGNGYAASNDILVIDGKAGPDPYTSHDISCQALDDAGYFGLYDEWIVSGNGEPDLSGYKAVIYQDGYGSYIYRNWQSQAFESPDRVNTFMDYLDAGGTMYLCGQSMASGLDSASAPEFETFLHDYLKTDYVAYDSNSLVANGVAGDEITNGLSGALAENGGLPLGTDDIDRNDTSADEIFRDGSLNVTGVKYDSGFFKTAFTSFNLCQYGNDAQRATLADRIVTWLTSLLAHDARTNTLDSHQNDTTYYNGLQNIQATVENHGSTAESFDARCVITEFQPPGPPTVMLDENFDGNSQSFTVDSPWVWTKTIDRCEHPGNEWTSKAIYSPSLDFTGKTGTVELQFWHDWEGYSAFNAQGWVELSLDGGASWPSTSSDPRVVAIFSQFDPHLVQTEVFDIGDIVAGYNDVIIRWMYYDDAGWPWYVDDVLVTHIGTITEVEVYNQTRTTSTLDPWQTEQLTWSYDFLSTNDYRIRVYTELASDENALNDEKQAIVHMVARPSDDVGVNSIDTHTDGGTYPTGAQDVNATVMNYGANSQATFEVNCTIQRLDAPAIGDVAFSEDFTSGSGDDFADLASGVWTTESYGPAQDWELDTTGDQARVFSELADSDEWLITPVIDLGAYTNGEVINLTFYQHYNYYFNDVAYIYLSTDGGGSWPVTLAEYHEDHFGLLEDPPIPTVIDISAYGGQSNVKLAFRYVANDDWSWWLDDLSITWYLPAVEPIVYASTIWTTTNPMDQYVTEQLTWNYDFPTSADYRITITTLLVGDLVPENDVRRIEITIAGGPPFVTSTTPADGAVDYPMTAGTYRIIFSEDMDSSFTDPVSNLPGVSWAWFSLTELRGTYGALAESTLYTINLSSSGFRDLALNALVGDVEFNFTTIGINPEIDWTTPVDGATGVSVAAGTYIIHFNESMDPSYSPPHTNLPGVSWAWNGAQQLEGSYGVLAASTDYWVDLTGKGFTDVPGNPLVGDMNMTFQTDGPPTITSTTPNDGATGVGTVASTYYVYFSEPMNTITNLDPLSDLPTVVWTWFSNTELRGTYGALEQATTYYVDLTGRNFKDVGGAPLSGDTYKNFTTTDLTPSVTSSTPEDMAVDVSVASDWMIINFSEEMDPAYGNVVTPNLATAVPFITGWSWFNGNTQIRAQYDTLQPATDYDVEVQDYRDLTGNVVFGGTWIFFTTIDAPYVVSTDPPDGAIEVPVAAGTYWINFSGEMNDALGTVETNLPGAAPWVWNAQHTNLTKAYNALAEQTTYYVNLSGFEDIGGTPLGGDVEFNFTTVSPPYVTATTPADGAVDVAITAGLYVIQFSEPMDESAVITLDTDLPLSGGGFWFSSTEYRVNYNVLNDSTTYYMDVSAAGFVDLDGYSLIGDTYFVFTTVDLVPTVTSTVPADGATGIPLAAGTYVIFFSEPMDATFTDPVSDLPGVSWSWNSTVELWGSYGALASDTLYTVNVSASGFRDAELTALGGDVEFVFTTIDITPPAPPTGLTVEHWGVGGGGYKECNATAQHGFDDTGEPLFNIQEDDGLYYRVSKGSDLWVENFNATGLLEPITGVTLVVEFTVGSAYTGTQNVTWAFDGDVPTDTDIRPAVGDTDRVATYDLYAIGLDTIAEISTFEIEFLNDAGGNPADKDVDFDYIWLNVTFGSGSPADHNTLNWTLSADDGAGSGDVTEYRIYRSDQAAGPWDETAYVASVPAGTDTYMDLNRGEADATYWWYVVRANDTSGNLESNLVAVQEPGGAVLDDVPLPVIHLNLNVDGSNNPVLSWTLQTEDANRTRDAAQGIRIFRSADKFAWNYDLVVGDLVATLGDGNTTWTDVDVSSGTYYYYVRTWNTGAPGTGLSSLSTMGAYHTFSFTYNAGIGNDNWLSMPMNSSYVMASDIVLDLEGALSPGGVNQYINYIGKWDPATQGVTEAYFYQEVGPPALWGWNGGADFAINPGDSITLQLSGNTGSFDWHVAGTDVRCTKDFTYNAGIGNDNWITVPWTGQYANASDIVNALEGGTGSGTDVYINYIGKWDPATQGVTEAYFYQEVGPPALWGWNGGADFAIAPGDGITIQLSGNTANFNWLMALVSNPVPDSMWP